MLQKPYAGNENYIFISYAHKDSEEVSAFIETLQKNGYHVWYDEGIDPGTEWDENIATHIEQCAYFISYITGHYLNSQNCRDELNFARDLEKERLLIYGEDVDLPKGMQMRLGRLQAIYKNKYKDETAFYTKVFQAEGISACREGSAPKTIDTPIHVSTPPKKTINSKVVLIIVIAAIAVLAGLFAVLHNSSNDSDAGSDANSVNNSTAAKDAGGNDVHTADGRLSITGIKIKGADEDGIRYYDILVRNDTDGPINTIILTVDFLDKDENIIDTLYPSLQNVVQPGKTIAIEGFFEEGTGVYLTSSDYSYYEGNNDLGTYVDGSFTTIPDPVPLDEIKEYKYQ